MKVHSNLISSLFIQKIENNPVVNSRYLMFEAQQAHYYGLSPTLALASVTSTPAKAAGMDHRVGTIAEGLSLDTSYPYPSLTFTIQDMMLVSICIHNSYPHFSSITCRYCHLELPPACTRSNSSTSLYRRYSST